MKSDIFYLKIEHFSTHYREYNKHGASNNIAACRQARNYIQIFLVLSYIELANFDTSVYFYIQLTRDS